MTHYVYILRCGDNTLYTGYTNRLEERLQAHRNGTGAKYTRGRAPFELVHTEEFNAKSEAMSREHEIKKLSRDSKIRLIENNARNQDR